MEYFIISLYLLNMMESVLFNVLFKLGLTKNKAARIIIWLLFLDGIVK